MFIQKKGFSLIELLVVIAIIGILSSVVLSGLNASRQKARDAKRLSDIKQIQLALDLYFEQHTAYPGTLSALVPSYIVTLPVPPVSTIQSSYTYVPINSGGCNNYHLGAIFETGNAVLSSDANTSGGTVASGCGTAVTATADFNGATNDCGTGGSAVGTPLCYDVMSQ